VRNLCPVCFRPVATDRDDVVWRARGGIWTDEDPYGGSLCWAAFDPGSCLPFAAAVALELKACADASRVAQNGPDPLRVSE
jgi:hypothetical protein